MVGSLALLVCDALCSASDLVLRMEFLLIESTCSHSIFTRASHAHRENRLSLSLTTEPKAL